MSKNSTANHSTAIELGFEDEFLDHYTMMVESMEVMIEDLSKQTMQKRCVEELCRVFHTIVSVSTFLKIEPMIRLATLVENELKQLKDKNTPVNNETINWLFKISKMFAKWQTNMKTGEELAKVEYSLLKRPDLEKI